MDSWMTTSEATEKRGNTFGHCFALGQNLPENVHQLQKFISRVTGGVRRRATYGIKAVCVYFSTPFGSQQSELRRRSYEQNSGQRSGCKTGQKLPKLSNEFWEMILQQKASQICQEMYQDLNEVLGSWTKEENTKKHQGSHILVKCKVSRSNRESWPCRTYHWFWLPSKPKISYMRPTWIHKHVGRSKESEDGVQIRIHKLHWRRNHWANRKES